MTYYFCAPTHCYLKSSTNANEHLTTKILHVQWVASKLKLKLSQPLAYRCSAHVEVKLMAKLM